MFIILIKLEYIYSEMELTVDEKLLPRHAFLSANVVSYSA
jgi:hypothetical protein